MGNLCAVGAFARTKIVRLLQQAEAEGIVRVSVRARKGYIPLWKPRWKNATACAKPWWRMCRRGRLLPNCTRIWEKLAAGYLTPLPLARLGDWHLLGAALLAMVNALQPQKLPGRYRGADGWWTGTGRARRARPFEVPPTGRQAVQPIVACFRCPAWWIAARSKRPSG
jgi:hypothetical protein